MIQLYYYKNYIHYLPSEVSWLLVDKAARFLLSAGSIWLHCNPKKFTFVYFDGHIRELSISKFCIFLAPTWMMSYSRIYQYGRPSWSFIHQNLAKKMMLTLPLVKMSECCHQFVSIHLVVSWVHGKNNIINSCTLWLGFFVKVFG